MNLGEFERSNSRLGGFLLTELWYLLITTFSYLTEYFIWLQMWLGAAIQENRQRLEFKAKEMLQKLKQYFICWVCRV